MIVIRLDQLIFEKQAEWGKKLTYREIAKATDVSLATLARWRVGKGDGQTRINLIALNALCAFFDCQPGDLLTYQPDD